MTKELNRGSMEEKVEKRKKGQKRWKEELTNYGRQKKEWKDEMEE